MSSKANKTIESIDHEGSLDQLINELSTELGDSLDPSLPSNPADKYKLSSFPTTMSCMSVFDELVDCYSIGGQVRHVYRYGSMNHCVDTRSKLKFCLFTKLSSSEEQKKRIAKFYMERLARQKLEKGSSEDIWSVREVPVEKPFLEVVKEER